jgi:hypothetical protein
MRIKVEDFLQKRRHKIIDLPKRVEKRPQGGVLKEVALWGDDRMRWP